MRKTTATQFRITQFDAKTLSWWKTRRTKIDMDPPYQRRGRLWSETDKAYLIDSILNGYDIPKLYIADFTWGDSALNERKLPYAIIDGKQRFEAILDFFDGKTVLNKDFVYVGNPSLTIAGLSYKDLQKSYPQVAEEFDNYNLTVMSVAAKNEKPINELFVRLNRSKSLTGAEIRNAMAGPAPEVIRTIASHELFTENVKFSTKRRQDLNAAAKILLFEYADQLRETKKKNLDEFAREKGSEQGPLLELRGRRVIDTLQQMAEIFLPKDPLLSSAGVFPVYFWLVRNSDEKNNHLLREFLVQFDADRRENRLLMAETPESGKIDPELNKFDRYNRSTDDSESHRVRYTILKKRFDQLIALRS